MNPRIVLASQSPRRKQLLESAGYRFDIVLPSETAECGICSKESTPELVARLAYQKAKDVEPRVDGPAIIVACDTVADIMGRVLGKPEDRRHAEEMIRLLSGREHGVYSGLCVTRIGDSAASDPLVEVSKSTLAMEKLTDAQIEEYLDIEDWVGKSGAFGYQDNHPWLKLISGTAENVVGLPLDVLGRLLAQVGYQPN
ncbi:MAG TPA: septum formation protein Maf [Planctomycetaceae bacterium]|nr:septum formation protein Maf [Planctomycetaceae bacterium]